MVEQLSTINESVTQVQLCFREGSTTDSRQDQVQLSGALEAKFERNDERVVHLSKNRPFRQRMRNLVSTRDMRFADCLECVDTRCVALANLHDLSKRPLSDDFQQVERVDGQ